MRYNKLGDSDLEASALAFGAWQIGDAAYWGEDDETDAAASVHAAIDAGVNFFDTAEMYGAGQSEEVLGRALKGRRDEVLIASKVMPQNCAPELLRKSCEATLQRLGTDRIDLYQVHWPPRDVPFSDVGDELLRLREEGKIREIGVSNFGPIDLKDWLSIGPCVTNQIGYNLIFRAPEHEILPACANANVGVLVYMPLLQGILANRWKTIEDIPQSRRRTRHFSSERPGTRHGEPGCETLLLSALNDICAIADQLEQPMANVAIAWLLTKKPVVSVIVGARNPAQLRRNVAAADLVLSSETVAKLDEVTQPLKDHFGLNADMWQGLDGARIR